MCPTPVRALAGALLVTLAGSAALGLCACGGEGAKTALGYTEDAKRAYDAALEEYNAHSWIQAQTLMREVKRKYSYSKYARLAELRIADADFEQEKYSEAIHEFKDFIHAHRSDADDVAYARSRIAEAVYAEIPETALVGAPEERDQASVVDAYKELNSYLTDYPGSKQTAHIHELLAQVVARLVRHELYVARFYLTRNNYDAAIARIQYALHNYSPAGAPHQEATADLDLDAEALLLLGQTYLRMHRWVDARHVFESILHGHAQSPLVVQARDYLQHLSEQGA